jgi:hypothetical protein
MVDRLKQLHVESTSIISLKREFRSIELVLTPPLFIEVPVPRQESEQSCICVLGVLILPLSTILIFDFGIVLTAGYFLSPRQRSCKGI